MNLSEIQIDRKALLHNVQTLRSVVDVDTELVAVVKGNAYGHGLVEVVQTLESKVDAFQVDDIDELRILRRHSTKRALVLGYVPLGDVEEAVQLQGELAVYDVGRLPAIAQAGSSLGLSPVVHLKVDALLGRQGVMPSELSEMIRHLENEPSIRVASIYAHFANIEDTTDLGHAQEQIDLFDQCWSLIRERAGRPIGRHLSATSGLMTVEHLNDMVRLGLGIYGMYPSASLARSHSHLELRPAMRWVSHLAQVKTLPARHPVGYGLTYVTPRPMKVGIVPQGYADGFDRGFSNVGEVLVNGVRCAILGRIAMNMFTIDLTNVPGAGPEDEVVLLGRQKDDCISAEELASRLGTINYEITTRVSSLLPRRIV